MTLTKSNENSKKRTLDETSDDSNQNAEQHKEERRANYKKIHNMNKSKRSRVNKEETIVNKKFKRISPPHLEHESQPENNSDFNESVTENKKLSPNTVSGGYPISISSNDGSSSNIGLHSQSSQLENNETVEEIVSEEDLPNYYPAIDGCRSVEEFQCLNRVEEGSYGVVYRAKDKRTKEIVALKRIKMEHEKEGFPITSLREINTLLKGQHENIVTLREVVVSKHLDKFFIVMDFIEHDLKSLIEVMKHKKQTFTIGEVKCLLKQLLTAVAHLHYNWILHRDLKTSNLLLSHKGILKVADFGLAREYGMPVKPYTPVVVTLWYRAPELLLSTKLYSTAIDIWSVGCIFAELLLMNPLFPGKSELDQVNKIFKFLGTPSEEVWPGFDQLPACQRIKFTQYRISDLRSRFYVLGEIGLTLIQNFFIYDPDKRIDAEDALEHSYFNEQPLPIEPSMFPTWPAKSEVGHQNAFASSNGPNESADLGNERVPRGGGFCLRF